MGGALEALEYSKLTKHNFSRVQIMTCFLTLFGPCSKFFVLGWLGGFDGNFLWNRIGAGKDFNSPYKSTHEIEASCPSQDPTLNL